MNLVIAKSAKGGRKYEAVVMDTDKSNLIVYRSGLGWNIAGRERCAGWRDMREKQEQREERV